ncbi:spore protease YyaC [Aquibacillus albus]|uniref:Sporulation protein YyaC n=1 Tax=Aquibacillus albus TaxID=1168171 RepID=A0ABS2N2Z8_9BACI|nr:spore protease YyaC [Aquibacillus albus]MBM7572529.1 putative sporulation protein YyaC [Aquibacillus albus]
MNLKRKFSQKNEYRYNFDEPMMETKLSKSLLSLIPNNSIQIIILCIGTDRSTGDSLGPMTGTFLSEFPHKHLHVYGTLDEPIHATNLQNHLQAIHSSFDNPFIIAVDACLGRVKSIGSVITAPGPIQPGKALNKDLPKVGDVHISGVVNVSGYMEFFVLQNTRLSLVMQMARKISSAFYLLDHQLSEQIAPSPSTNIIAHDGQRSSSI